MGSRRQSRTAGNSPLNSLERMDWESLNLGELTEDPRLQMRLEGLDEKHVRDLMAVVEDKGIDEPITVIREGKILWLADGFHRVEAYRRAAIAKDLKWEKQIIRAIVLTGTFDDAKQLARKANLRHGKALSPASRKAILFDMIRGNEEINGIAVKRLSNGVLGAELGVHADTISEWFKELITEGSTNGNPLVIPEDRAIVYGRDGREYQIENITVAQQKRAAEAAERRATEEAERKKNLPAIEKIRLVTQYLISKYRDDHKKKGKPLLDDPDKGYKWCYQVSNPVFVVDIDWERQFLAEYGARPVGLYREFLRMVDQATFIEADMDHWSDEQMADWVYAMKQRGPRQMSAPVETFQRGGMMAQPKNPNLEYQPPAPVGRHRLTEVEIENEKRSDPFSAGSPFQIGDRVRVRHSKKQVGPVEDTRWCDNAWQVYVDLGNNHMWVYTDSLEHDEITKPSVEPSLVHLSDLPPINDCPFYVDQQVRIIATGEIDTIHNTKWEDGEWRIWLANGEDFNRVHELSPASRFTVAEPQAYKPSNGTQTQMAENYIALMKLIQQITEGSLALKKFDFNLQYLQPPEVLGGIWDTLAWMRDQTMETFTVVAERLNEMADTGLPYDPILAEETLKKGMQRV